MRIDESHSIRDIQKRALRIRSATFILDIQEIMMSFISETT